MVLEVAKDFQHRRFRTIHLGVPFRTAQPSQLIRRIQPTILAVWDSVHYLSLSHSEIYLPYPSPRFLCRFRCPVHESPDLLEARQGAICHPEVVGTYDGSCPIYPAPFLTGVSSDRYISEAQSSYHHLGNCTLRQSAKTSTDEGLMGAHLLHGNCDNAAHSPTCTSRHWRTMKSHSSVCAILSIHCCMVRTHAWHSRVCLIVSGIQVFLRTISILSIELRHHMNLRRQRQ